MNSKVKPKILVSRCIEHAQCRYDGSMISSEFVKRIKDYVTFETVCPEVEIGLPVPREAVRVVFKDKRRQLVSSMSGNDYTDQMNAFALDQGEKVRVEGFHGAILKSRSPSCGIKEVKMYSDIGRVPGLPDKTKGFFAETLMACNPLLPVEDEGRLLNFEIREHFLTRIYTLARFDAVKAQRTMASLVQFQSENKYLLMAYHQTEQKVLGKVVANHKKLPIEAVLEEYELHLKKALVNPLKKGKNTNMILHMFGYVSDELSSDEMIFFLDLLRLYNQHKKPLSAVMTVLYGWVIRFDTAYLKMQTIFEPYPIEILDFMDSGKGIK